MNNPVKPLLALTQRPIVALQELTNIGCLSTDRFTELNYYAGLAAIDNSTHHFSTLLTSKDPEEIIELQLQSLLPAAESAKAYVGRVVASATANARVFEDFLESQMSQLQEVFLGDLDAKLSHAEKTGIPTATLMKHVLQLTREAALSSQVSLRSTMHNALNWLDTKSY